ncbi:tail fiber assembly protein [Enterobacter hormaechei]
MYLLSFQLQRGSLVGHTNPPRPITPLAQVQIVFAGSLLAIKPGLNEGIATEEEAATLGKWKNYRVLLMRVNITALHWPTPPFE